MEELPEDCVSLVLSLTTPRDACRLSAVSPAFLSAAQSNLVWDRFLPPDSTPVMVPSKRELYFRLCDSIILIDEGKKMLWWEKATGKKCCMLSARALVITSGNDARFWKWISVSSDFPRFREVAEMVDVFWLEIRASINSRDLSPRTRYGAYLVMGLTDNPYHLEDPPQETVICVGGVPSSTGSVRLAPFDNHWGGEVIWVPRKREDGWMELQMGDFFVEAGAEELVDMRLNGWQGQRWKSGLIVRGIEVRPMP